MSYRSNFPHGLMFHRFHAEHDLPSGQGSLTPAQLEKILLFVGPENILSPQEWLSRLEEGVLRAQDLCLTLDDGLRSQYEICLPVLEKYGLKAFWFIFSSVLEGEAPKSEVYHLFAARYFRTADEFHHAFFARCPTSALKRLNDAQFVQRAETLKAAFPFYSTGDLHFRFLRNELLARDEFEAIMDAMIADHGTTTERLGKELWMTDRDLAELSLKGHCIGLHSHSHPFEFCKLPADEQEEEYARCYAHLARVCGQHITSMSHPLNSYNEVTLEILGKLGIRCGFRSNLSAPAGKPVNPSSLEWAREDSTNILRAL
jgi:peptidoglycan/xylan/chitin deacetylase (PgdA/CDA1 family)